jgi:hypothetical protein
MRAEDRLAAMFPGIDLDAASAAAAAALRPAPAKGLRPAVLRLGARVGAALGALTQSTLKLGAAEAPETASATPQLAAKLRELRECLPAGPDRATLLEECTAWVAVLRQQLVAQHGEAQARLELLKSELMLLDGELARVRAAEVAVDDQGALLETGRREALAALAAAKVGRALGRVGGMGGAEGLVQLGHGLAGGKRVTTQQSAPPGAARPSSPNLLWSCTRSIIIHGRPTGDAARAQGRLG